MTDTIRTFIAVRIPLGKRLQLVLDEFRTIGRPVKTVSDDQLHVTLKFFGDVRRNRTDEISGLLHDVCSRHSPFRLTIEGIGAFPLAARPSVIWAGLSSVQPLLEIVNEIEHASATFGYPKQTRPFHPHLTLARVRLARGTGTRLPVRLHQVMQEFRVMEFDPVDVHRIVFFRSQLTTDGHQYSELSAAELSS